MASKRALNADCVALDVRSCEGCGYRRKVALCGRFSFVKPHYLCDPCQKVLGAVSLGSFASMADAFMPPCTQCTGA